MSPYCVLLRTWTWFVRQWGTPSFLVARGEIELWGDSHSSCGFGLPFLPFPIPCVYVFPCRFSQGRMFPSLLSASLSLSLFVSVVFPGAFLIPPFLWENHSLQPFGQESGSADRALSVTVSLVKHVLSRPPDGRVTSYAPGWHMEWLSPFHLWHLF